MSLTRKQLKGMGLTDEQIEAVMEGHAETVDGLKQQIEAQRKPEKKPEEGDKKPEKKPEAEDDYKAKYEAEKAEFEAYKTAQAAKETAAKKQAAYVALLMKAGLSEARAKSAAKLADMDSIEMDGDAIKGSEELLKTMKTDWADLITVQKKGGAETPNPNGTDKGSAQPTSLVGALREMYERGE